MAFRDFKKDKLKSSQVLESQYGMSCCMDGCGKPLTKWQGPGQDLYCRDHQLKLVEYGGTGRSDRPHTLNREFVCDSCGKDVEAEVSNKFPGLRESDPRLFNRLCRNRIIGDHIVRKSDGGDDSKENIQSLCLDCNSDKTIMSEDYRKGVKLET